MSGTVTGLCPRVITALGLLLAAAATAVAQPVPTSPPLLLDLGSAPLFEPPPTLLSLNSTPPLKTGTPPLFALRQIVDRPTTDLRPRFHWGLIGSYVPRWTAPDSFVQMLLEQGLSGTMSGHDLRVGFVRSRQLGFEMGASFVRKTLSSFNLRIEPQESFFSGRVTYSNIGNIDMTGVDAHLVIPFKRLGERVQLGWLVGGGMAWVEDAPILKSVSGPPYSTSATCCGQLTTPPPGGGFVQDQYGRTYPVGPGQTTFTGEASFHQEAISPTDKYWMLLRGQLAADFLVAPPLKLRVAGGFSYPGIQAIGIDAVYMFRTGRVGSSASQPQPGAVNLPQADRARVIAPRRSYWGVLAGYAPRWWMPNSWGPLFEPNQPTEKMIGREFRVGITRGRPLGYEFGGSFVAKSITRFSFTRVGGTLIGPGQTAVAPEVALTHIDPVQMKGGEFHAFVPIARLGERIQLGGLLGIGGARVPDAPVRKTVTGPPFVATPTSTTPLTALPPAGGYVLDENYEAFFVAPGRTSVEVPATFTNTLSPLDSFFVLARGQLAADVLLVPSMKLRFSGGFNYPGAQVFNVEMVYMFGGGR